MYQSRSRKRSIEHSTNLEVSDSIADFLRMVEAYNLLYVANFRFALFQNSRVDMQDHIALGMYSWRVAWETTGGTQLDHVKGGQSTAVGDKQVGG